MRCTARDEEGSEHTTFREDIGKRAKQLQHTRVRIEYHEDRRGQYQNVYLDEIEPAEPASRDAGKGGTDAQAAAWHTAVEAAPWLIGEPQDAVEPEELYDKLKPFEERVAADIDHHQDPGTSDTE